MSSLYNVTKRPRFGEHLTQTNGQILNPRVGKTFYEDDILSFFLRSLNILLATVQPFAQGQSDGIIETLFRSKWKMENKSWKITRISSGKWCTVIKIKANSVLSSNSARSQDLGRGRGGTVPFPMLLWSAQSPHISGRILGIFNRLFLGAAQGMFAGEE
jgi:hypothetical protein